ncbi:MAG: CvpA family protein [Alphaproteobacteria bacterium]|nr:CvpA family protein [Alphaproteobacteria bacterium]
MAEYGSIIIDFGIIAVIAVSALLAYSRGLVREFLTVAVAAAGVATYYLFTQTTVGSFARGWVSNELVADSITVVAVFVGMVVLAVLITHPLAERVRGSNLGFLNRWLGFAWGTVRGFLILALLYVPVEATFFPVGTEKPAWLADAKLIPYVDAAGDWLVGLVPQGLREATTF